MSMLDPQQGRPSALPADARQELCRLWYEEHGRAIYSYLRFQLGSADEADDLTADVFLRAVRSAERFDPLRGTARSWLFRIAQNLLRDHGRRERRRRLVPAGAFRDLHTDAPSPEELVLWREEVGHLLEALAELSEGDRALVSLRYGSGLSTAEVAEVLGVREPAVRTRLWRALGRLRKALRP
jgi:RNA polymerase sigma-70 factor (ECF subfamily)